jgi:hypothetical protein
VVIKTALEAIRVPELVNTPDPIATPIVETRLIAEAVEPEEPGESIDRSSEVMDGI